MTIQKFLHSCLLIEENKTRILIDPGSFSFIEGKVKPETFTDIDAVFITHEHFDHVDIPNLKIILNNNSRAAVYGNSGVADSLKKADITVLPFEEGKKKFGTVEVEAIFSQHATTLWPSPKNTAFIFNGTILITGDSFDEGLEKLRGITVLALPVAAPWLRQVDAVAFAENIGAKTIIPVHDGFVKEFFLERQHAGFAKRFSELDINYKPLQLGESLEV